MSVSAEAGARAIKDWAIGAGLMDSNRHVLVVAQPMAPIAIQGAILGFADNAAIFRQKGIAFVAYNEQAPNVIVYTDKKLTKKDLKLLPHSLDEIEVVYEQGGHGYAGGTPPKPYPAGPYALFNERYTCGSSIGIGNVIDAGTLGCLVTDGISLFGLSNNHVTGNCNFTEPNFPIVAPGLADVQAGRLDPFTIGHHERVGPFLDGLPEMVDISANCDAAIFKISNPTILSSMQRTFFDTPPVAADLLPGMVVKKVGRTSVLSEGIVKGIVSGPEAIRYNVAGLGPKVVYFNSLFIVQSTVPGGRFAQPGDSGALVVSEINGVLHAVGLVVAGNEQTGISFVLPIQPILATLGVTLVSGHNV